MLHSLLLGAAFTPGLVLLTLMLWLAQRELAGPHAQSRFESPTDHGRCGLDSSSGGRIASGAGGYRSQTSVDPMPPAKFARRMLAICNGTNQGKWICILLAVAALAATMSLAQARDDGRYAHSPNRDWFRNLTNQDGIMCCEGADGVSLADPDWEFDGHGYRVRIEGHWMPVPPHALVRQQSKLSYAIVWPWKDGGQWRIRCFMAGAGT